MTSFVRFVAILSVLAPVTASAARIQPAGASASSSYPDGEGVSYDPAKVMDGKLSTSWVEGEQGSGLGSWIELDLGGEKTVEKIKVWAGMWYSNDYWKRANRPKEIEVVWADGSKDTFTLGDQMAVQEFTLGTSRRSATARVRVKGIYDGTTWLDTAISEIQFFDAASEERVAVRSFTASSTLPADADGNYAAGNVGDGILDSMWCEGNKAGDGTNEWIELGFGGATSVGKLTVVNGIGTSLPYWMKGNRAGTATLKFSDGSTETITLKNAMLPQTLTFSPRQAASVKITFSGIVKGKEFNDLCISEAYFAP